MNADYFPVFWDAMKNRCVSRFGTYGSWKENRHEIDFMNNVLLRIREYQRTGNTENLVDAANFLMAEWKYPSHINAHFSETDPGKSPGIVRLGSSKPVTSEDVYRRPGCG